MKLWPYLTLGLITGIVGLTLSWGDPAGFHGTGLPIPLVYWDNPSGTMVDYPNSFAYILNPLIGVILGITVWIAAKFYKRSDNESEPDR